MCCSSGGVYEQSRYGAGTGPVWLDHVVCQGTEMDLLHCQHDPWGQTACSHLDDVSLSCNTRGSPTQALTTTIATLTTMESYITTEPPAESG